VLELTLTQARNLHLAAQGLLMPPSGRATSSALRKCISRMRLLQIDTIHIVARSPYLVLFSRIGDYPMPWLDKALERAHVFETWAHEACFAPVQDMALHRSYNQTTRKHWGLARGREHHQQQRAHLNKLLDHIAETGPVKSSDFERSDGRTGGWWGWKDEKLWLEALFATGELMVAKRENFQRVYDLSVRVHPALAGMPSLHADDVHASFIEQSISALGITQARWIHDYFRIKPRLKDADLDALVDQGRVQRVRVQGWSLPGYVHSDNATSLKKTVRGGLHATHTALLSPFDPVVWDRERASGMFDFDYRIECYTPQEKRVHGYYVLPVLHCGRLVARLDAKAHRLQGVFEVKAFYLEAGVMFDQQMALELAAAIQRCAAWHGTPSVRIVYTSPHKAAALLRRALRALQKET
jgi:uncharacterized protein YcaQ